MYTSNKHRIISIVALIILIIVFLFVGFSPLNRITEFKNLVKNDSLYLTQYDSIYNNPDLDSLVKEKAYKQALLKLSEQDSIQLIINLHDSIISLSIKGVEIHKSHISSYKNDLIFEKLPTIEYVKLFSQPLKINAQKATIIKEPIVVRQAPKDTSEVDIQAYQPDTLIQNPAFIQLEIDYGIQIIIEQELNATFKDKWIRFRFKSNTIFNRIKHFFCFKNQNYHPTVTVKIPVDDLRAIYRALPTQSYVVLNYY